METLDSRINDRKYFFLQKKQLVIPASRFFDGSYFILGKYVVSGLLGLGMVSNSAYLAASDYISFLLIDE